MSIGTSNPLVLDAIHELESIEKILAVELANLKSVRDNPKDADTALQLSITGLTQAKSALKSTIDNLLRKAY